MFSYPWAGLDSQNGDPIGYLNGVPSKDYTALLGAGVSVYDLVYSGSVIPVYSGSMGNTIRYKNFQLTARITFKAGYFFRKESINYTNLFSAWDGNSDFANRWQHPGDEANTNVPSLVYPSVSNRDIFYNGAEILVRKGDHVRLQYINLDYSLSPRMLHYIFLKKLSIYANVNNLGVLWTANKEHVDPEYRSGIYPSKTFVIGLKAGL